MLNISKSNIDISFKDLESGNIWFITSIKSPIIEYNVREGNEDNITKWLKLLEIIPNDKPVDQDTKPVDKDNSINETLESDGNTAQPQPEEDNVSLIDNELYNAVQEELVSVDYEERIPTYSEDINYRIFTKKNKLPFIIYITNNGYEEVAIQKTNNDGSIKSYNFSHNNKNKVLNINYGESLFEIKDIDSKKVVDVENKVAEQD